MKKRLFLIPLVGGFLLSGCTFKLFGTTIRLFEKNTPQEENNEDTPEEEALPTIMREYGDYKLAESLVDGERYLLGNYRRSGDHMGEMRFFNGKYHTDPSKEAGHQEFSFYLGTQAAEDGDTSFAAEVEVNFVNDNEFTLKVHSPGNVWDNCYIGLYPSKAMSRYVISTCRLESLDQTTFTVVDGNGKDNDKITTEYEVTPDEIFTKYKFFNEYPLDNVMKEVKAAGIEYQYEENDEESALPKFFGTSGSYTSLDVQSVPTAIDPDAYDLAHFYVHK